MSTDRETAEPLTDPVDAVWDDLLDVTPPPDALREALIGAMADPMTFALMEDMRASRVPGRWEQVVDIMAERHPALRAQGVVQSPEREAVLRAAYNVTDRRTLIEDGYLVSKKEMRALDDALAKAPPRETAFALAVPAPTLPALDAETLAEATAFHDELWPADEPIEVRRVITKDGLIVIVGPFRYPGEALRDAV